MPVHSAFLKYFDEVCKSGSIRKAATKLFVASSAVNRQILKIEDELETKLFERTPRGIRLTETGKLLEQHISRTLADAERTFQEMEALQENTIRGITIVGQDSVITRFLPPALVALHAEFPNVAMSFMATSGRGMSELLLNGTADIALAFDMKVGPELEKIASIMLPIGAVLSPSHPLSNRKSISVSECTEFPFILPDESWPIRDVLDAELKDLNIDKGSITTSNSVEFLRSMLGEDQYIGFQTIFGLEVAVDSGALTHIPLLNKFGEALVQEFSISINRHCEENPVIQSVLPLLKQRILSYNTD